MCVEIAGQVANNADTDQMPYRIWSGPTNNKGKYRNYQKHVITCNLAYFVNISTQSPFLWMRKLTYECEN